MSIEPRADNISCEFRDADGFEATKGKLRQWRRREW